MKKTYQSLFAVLLAMVGLSSCDDDNNTSVFVEPEAITIIDRETNFPAAASTGSVQFKAEGDVAVSTSTDWLSATVEDNKILIECKQNDDLMSRTGIITAKSKAGTTEINVIQEGIIFEIPDVDQLSFKSFGAFREFAVTTNVPVVIESDDEWITGSYSDGKVRITVTDNPSFDGREGSFIAKFGKYTSEVAVNQEGATLEIFEMTEWNCPDTRKTMSFDLPFDCDIQFETSNPDWLVSTVNPNTRKWTITASANNTGHVRNGSFTYNVNGHTGTVNVTQCNFAKDLAGTNYRVYFTMYNEELKQDVKMYFEGQMKKVGVSYRVVIPNLENLYIPMGFDTDNNLFTLTGGQFCGSYAGNRVYTVFDFRDVDGTYLSWSDEWTMIAKPVYNEATGETSIKFADSGKNPYDLTAFELHMFASAQLSGSTMRGTLVLLRDMDIVKMP